MATKFRVRTWMHWVVRAQRRIDRVLAELDSSPLQFEILENLDHLALCGADPLSVAELAELAGVTISVASRALRVLEEKGLVQIVQAAGDRRRFNVDLTLRGAKRLQILRQRLSNLESELMRGLDSSEMQFIRRLARKLLKEAGESTPAELTC